MLLQIVLFHSFLWLNNIHMYIFFIYSSVNDLGCFHVLDIVNSAAVNIVVDISFFFLLFRAAPIAYGGSQARGRIRTMAAGLCHSHRNAGSKIHLWPTLQLRATLDLWPLSKARGWIHILMDTSWIHFPCTMTGSPYIFWNIVLSHNMSRSGTAGSYGNSIFSFFEEPPCCFP